VLNALQPRDLPDPTGIIHPGVFPIDNPHALARIEKILAQRIAVQATRGSGWAFSAFRIDSASFTTSAPSGRKYPSSPGF
jgi:hypothetical protein